VFDGTNAYLGRHWLITPQNQPQDSVLLRLYFSMQELNDMISASQATPNASDDISSINDIVVVKYDGPTEDNVMDFSDAVTLVVLTPVSRGSDLNGLYLDVWVRSFSEFWIGGSGSNPGPLPITFESQHAQCEESSLSLRLRTASESENAGFWVQRSTDLEAWSSLGWVEGMGTQSVGQDYHFEVTEGYRQPGYYRWLQVDYDGTQSPGPALYAFCGQAENNALLHAGWDEGLMLKLRWMSSGEGEVELMDLQGRRLLHTPVMLEEGTSQLRLGSIERPASGIYLLRIKQGSEEILQRVVLM
jgi:hypothetical protein